MQKVRILKPKKVTYVSSGLKKKKKKKKEEKTLEENFPIRNELEMNNTQINYLEFALGWEKNSAWVLLTTSMKAWNGLLKAD